ncbi:Cytosine deaminase [Rhizina undulata]
MDDKKGLSIAFSEAQAGYQEGGIPAEMAAIEAAGRLNPAVYKDATMYTTLSPCDMCTGACLLYGIKRVVIGENRTLVGGEELLKQRGVEVVNLDDKECWTLMQKFVRERPEVWGEDIGEEVVAGKF